jgi:6-phosphogluconate dehydrogenase
VSTFAIIGLGRIGGGLALQALEKGHRVVGFDVAGASAELINAGLIEASDLSDLSDKFDSEEGPGIVFL